MSSQKKQIIFLVTLLVILVGIASRLFDLELNFSPLGAILLFGAAYFRKKALAFLIPLALYWGTDLYLNNVVYAAYFDGFTLLGDMSVYLSILLIVVLGIFMLQKVTITNVLASSILAAVIFFLVTNFFAMLNLPEYTKDISGLMASYTAGIPFFRMTLLGNLIFSTILFTAFELFLRSPSFSEVKARETIKS